MNHNVSVNLTREQEESLVKMAASRNIGLSILLRLLILYFIRNARGEILFLDVLLKAYHGVQRNQDKKTRKITVRIREAQFKELSDLANQWFYLPGELAGILVELLISGVININSIWNPGTHQPTPAGISPPSNPGLPRNTAATMGSIGQPTHYGGQSPL